MANTETLTNILKNLKRENRLMGNINCRLGNDSYTERLKASIKRRKENVKIDTGVIGYNLVLLDSSVTAPLILNQNIIREVNNRFLHIDNERERASEIFNWMQKEVVYGESRRGEVGYRNSIETLERKEGVCGEMAYLYVITARASGLKSQYVSVGKDYNGNRVSHGCAGVLIPNLVMVDPAYHMFDVKHQEIEILDDVKMIENFKSWRGNVN